MEQIKDKAYYARLAERKYASMFAGEQDGARMFVLVDMKDDFCMLDTEPMTPSVSQLVFMCRKTGGEVTVVFLRGGMDRVDEALRLKDDERFQTEKIYGELTDRDAPEVRYKIPEKLVGHVYSFKMRLCGLEDFVDEFDAIGWGDTEYRNVLEVAGEILREDVVDTEHNEVQGQLYAEVCPNDDDTEEGCMVYALFSFSHFEYVTYNDVCQVVYVCYGYRGTIVDD